VFTYTYSVHLQSSPTLGRRLSGELSKQLDEKLKEFSAPTTKDGKRIKVGIGLEETG
jgi:hypothetical protein